MWAKGQKRISKREAFIRARDEYKKTNIPRAVIYHLFDRSYYSVRISELTDEGKYKFDYDLIDTVGFDVEKVIKFLEYLETIRCDFCNAFDCKNLHNSKKEIEAKERSERLIRELELADE